MADRALLPKRHCAKCGREYSYRRAAPSGHTCQPVQLLAPIRDTNTSRCKVGYVRDRMTPDEQTRLDEVLADAVTYPAPKIALAFRQAGYIISHALVAKHRRGACCCGPVGTALVPVFTALESYTAGKARLRFLNERIRVWKEHRRAAVLALAREHRAVEVAFKHIEKLANGEKKHIVSSGNMDTDRPSEVDFDMDTGRPREACAPFKFNSLTPGLTQERVNTKPLIALQRDGWVVSAVLDALIQYRFELTKDVVGQMLHHSYAEAWDYLEGSADRQLVEAETGDELEEVERLTAYALQLDPR